MTHGKLLAQLHTLTDEQLDMDVTVYDEHEDEFFSVVSLKKIEEDEVGSDVGHPYLKF